MGYVVATSKKIKMDIMDPLNFKKYYTGVFKGMEITGRTYFPDQKTPEEKAQAALDAGYWDIRILNVILAKELNKQGCLNVGICPVCGENPIGTDSTWPYYWGWYSGPTLYLCKKCYENGMQQKLELEHNKKKGCFIATACYRDENAPQLIALRNYRDCVLINNYWGSKFIRLYYFISPHIAKILINNMTLSNLVKRIILNNITNKIMKIK